MSRSRNHFASRMRVPFLRRSMHDEPRVRRCLPGRTAHWQVLAVLTAVLLGCGQPKGKTVFVTARPTLRVRASGQRPNPMRIGDFRGRRLSGDRLSERRPNWQGVGGAQRWFWGIACVIAMALPIGPPLGGWSQRQGRQAGHRVVPIADDDDFTLVIDLVNVATQVVLQVSNLDSHVSYYSHNT